MGMMNHKRAGWARNAIDTFMDDTKTDKEDAIADLLCDLMHMCDQDANFGNFKEQAERAVRIYEGEIIDDE